MGFKTLIIINNNRGSHNHSDNTWFILYAFSCQLCHCARVVLLCEVMLAQYILSSCVCLSCLFITRQYCIETTGRIELVLACRLPSTYPTLCFKEIWLLPKIRVLPLELCPKLRKFHHGKSVVWSTTRWRSSLLMTPICQSTYRGCWLHVGQL